MNSIKPILFAALGLAAALLVLFFILRLVKRLRISAALQAPRSRQYIQNLLSAAFSADSVKYSVRLPAKLYSDPSFAMTIDCMLISRGGITIMDILPARGALDNPFVGDWGMKTAEGVQTVPNPFEIGARHAEALRRLLASRGIYNTAIHVIALLPGERTVLHYHNDKILTPARLIPYIHDLDQNRFLGRSEQKKTAALLELYTAKAVRSRQKTRDSRK